MFSIIVLSHNKPGLVGEAIDSMVRQSYPNWEAIVIDSGVLLDAGHFATLPCAGDSKISFVRSNETPELRVTTGIAPWCFNEAFRRGLVHGDLVMYLCDDDILYPNAFQTFVDYSHEHPDALAMYASEDFWWIDSHGREGGHGERRALVPAGKSCNGLCRPRDNAFRV